VSCRNSYEVAIRGLVIAGFVTSGIGCKANYPEGPTPTPALAGIQLHYSSNHEFINPGSFARLILYAIDTEGVYQDVSTRASWVSGNTSIFTSAGIGSVRGVSDGTANMIATYQGLTTTATIVVARNPQGLDLDLPFTIPVGETGQATARQLNIARTDVTSRCTWTSSDPRVVTVEAGNVTAHGPGTASITARFETFGSATIYLSVPPIRSLP
jgi:Big-like domain-containing protein